MFNRVFPVNSNFTKKWAFLQPIIGISSFIFMSLNALFWTLLIHLLAPLLWFKKPSCKAFAEQCFDRIYHAWITANQWWFQKVLGVQWELDQSMQEDFDNWHLVIANHRSWVDVFVIFAQLKGRRPLPRVFMKQALIWLPFVGTATLIMGFPFMKRYSKETLRKHPHLSGKDLETTKRSCLRLLRQPSSIMNFVEGTRFTKEKHQQQASPYACLLNPKAGGIGFALQTMQGKIHSITDINVLYEQEKPTGWDLLCGRIGRVKVMVREVALPSTMITGPYEAAQADREHFFAWFNAYWHDKDVRMNHQLEALQQEVKMSNSAFEEGTISEETSSQE